MKQQADKKRSDMVLKVDVGSSLNCNLIDKCPLNKEDGTSFLLRVLVPSKIPQLSQVTDLPSCNKGHLEVEPVAILDRKMVKKNGLVQLANGTAEDPAWEP
ncbi:hypothetical protein Tco_0906020 [Tanacetum coccineum]